MWALLNVSTSDFQSEVGEVFGEIGGEPPAKFGGRFSSFFCWGKSSEAFSTKTPPQISPSNFTTRLWAVAGPINGGQRNGGGGCDISVARACADAHHANDTRAVPQTTLIVAPKSRLIASSARHLLVTEKNVPPI